MGFLDFLMKKKEPPTPPAEPRAVTAEELKALVQERQGAVLKPLLEESGSLLERIREDAKALQEKIVAFKALPVKEGIDFRNIAVQTKENYCVRVSAALNSLDFPSTHALSLDALQRFSHKLQEVTKSILKTTVDNRYSFAFFRKELDAIASDMKKLGGHAGQLSKKVTDKSVQFNRFQSVLDALKKFDGLKKKQALLKEQESSEKEALHKAETTLSGLEEKMSASQEFRQTRQELEAVQAEAASVKNQVASRLQALARALRKFERVCLDKALATTAKEYAENALTAFLSESEGHPRLKALLAALEDSLNKRGIEETEAERQKLLEKIRGMQVDSLHEELKAALEKEKALRESLLPLHALEREIDFARHEREEKESELKKTQEELKRLKEEERALENGLSQRATQVLGVQVTLKQESA